MKVVQKRRLLAKDSKGFFKNNDNFELLRSRAVISEQSVLNSEATYKETGILYVVDEAETKKFLDSKKPKKAVKKQPAKTDKTEE